MSSKVEIEAEAGLAALKRAVAAFNVSVTDAARERIGIDLPIAPPQ